VPSPEKESATDFFCSTTYTHVCNGVNVERHSKLTGWLESVREVPPLEKLHKFPNPLPFSSISSAACSGMNILIALSRISREASHRYGAHAVAGGEVPVAKLLPG